VATTINESAGIGAGVKAQLAASFYIVTFSSSASKDSAFTFHVTGP
jgi:hypothetical protein